MKKFLVVAALVLSAPAFAENYTVDNKHTFPSFEVSHLGLSTQRGRFNVTSGKMTLEREAKKGSVELEIDAGSVSTGLAELEKHLRNEDFFNVTKFPKMTFKSTKVDFEGDIPKAVHGDFTLLGVTKPVTLSVSSFNCKTHPMNKKFFCGADATAVIKRSDFGMKYGLPAVGDEVRLLIQFEAVRD